MLFGFGKGLVLRVVEPRLSGAEEKYLNFSLKQATKGITIGRLESNSITVPAGIATQKDVSREHGKIIYDKEKLWYEDTSSKGTPLSRGGHEWRVHNQLIEIQEGDIMAFGLVQDGQFLAGIKVTVHRFKK